MVVLVPAPPVARSYLLAITTFTHVNTVSHLPPQITGRVGDHDALKDDISEGLCAFAFCLGCPEESNFQAFLSGPED